MFLSLELVVHDMCGIYVKILWRYLVFIQMLKVTAEQYTVVVIGEGVLKCNGTNTE